MTIEIFGKNTTVRDSFKEIVEKKLGKFDRFFDGTARADVKVTRESDRETVEVTISSHGMFYRSESTTDDRVTSLDDVVDKLSRQIAKNKSKIKARQRSSDVPVQDFSGFDNDDITDEFNIIKTKQFSLKPMFPDEAILQMNLIGHSFFMFRNAENDQVSVVYKRNDGNYGLIGSTN